MKIPPVHVLLAFSLFILEPAFAQQQELRREIILSAPDRRSDPDESPYAAAEILPVGNSGTVTAQREDFTTPAVYILDLADAPLPALVNALARTLYKAPDFTRPVGSVFIFDGAASGRFVSLDLETGALAETLDQVAIASGCNIYLDESTIIVDRCSH